MPLGDLKSTSKTMALYGGENIVVNQVIIISLISYYYHYNISFIQTALMKATLQLYASHV